MSKACPNQDRSRTRLLPWFILFAVAVSVAFLGRTAEAESRNLSWDSCTGSAPGAGNKVFPCDDEWAVHNLFLSFTTPPAGVANFNALEAQLTIQAQADSLPDWWMLDGCRNGYSITTSGPGGCTNAWTISPFIVSSYVVHPSRPGGGSIQNRAVLRLAIASSGTAQLAGGQKYFAAKVQINSSGTVDDPVCSGCEVPVCVRLDWIKLQSASDPDPITLTGSAAENMVAWQSAVCADSMFKPVLLGMNANCGVAGDPVQLVGYNFANTTGVTFAPGVAANFTAVSDTVILTTVPAGAGIGSVVVTNPGGTSDPNCGCSWFGVSRITGVSPPAGRPGSTVAITGNFPTSATSVEFNGTPAAWSWTNPGLEISATVPLEAHSGPVRVKPVCSVGKAESPAPFVVAPRILGVDPVCGVPGSVVTISGYNFANATAVSFPPVPAAGFTIVDDTRIRATVPEGVGRCNITVTNPGGANVQETFFTGLFDVPFVSGFSPSSGGEGTVVILTGNFSGPVSGVAFGGVSASWVDSCFIDYCGFIRTAVPVGAHSGLITVSVCGGVVASRDSFIVTGTTGVEPGPLALALQRPRPNPARGDVELAYSLSRPGRVDLSVYNVLGARVRVLVGQELPAGAHSAHWDGRDARGKAVPAGVYLAKLDAEGRTIRRQIVQLR